MSFELFHTYWNPSRWEKLTICCPQGYQSHTVPNQQVDDTDSWLPHHQPIRRVSMSWPCTHKHIPTLSLKTYPWKSLGSSNLLSINYLDSLVSACNKCCALLHHNPVWRLTLLHTAKLTQVWFGGTCIWGNPWKGQSWKVSIDSPPWQVFWWRVVWAAHHTGH